MKLKTFVKELQSILDDQPKLANAKVILKTFAVCGAEEAARSGISLGVLHTGGKERPIVLLESKRYLDYIDSEY